MKETKPSIQQWQRAVEISHKFMVSKPWEQFEDMEIFVLTLPQHKEKVYASILGFHRMCYGLSFYQGKEGFKDLSSVAFEIDNEEFQNYLAMESHFYSVYFDDQENVTHEQKEAYEELGLHQSEFPHFIVKEKGCFPDSPCGKELEETILYMDALLDAIEYFFKEEVKIDFRKSMFHYEVSKKEGKPVPLHFDPRIFDPILPTDEPFLDHIASISTNEEVWEMEYNYIHQGRQREDGRVENVRLIMCACLDDRSMLSCVPLESEKDENEMVLNTLFQLIERNGRPLNIQICNARLLPLLGPTCDRLNIALSMCDEFEIIDEFLEGLYAFNAKEDSERS